MRACFRLPAWEWQSLRVIVVVCGACGVHVDRNDNDTLHAHLHMQTQRERSHSPHTTHTLHTPHTYPTHCAARVNPSLFACACQTTNGTHYYNILALGKVSSQAPSAVTWSQQVEMVGTCCSCNFNNNSSNNNQRGSH